MPLKVDQGIESYNGDAMIEMRKRKISGKITNTGSSTTVNHISPDGILKMSNDIGDDFSDDEDDTPPVSRNELTTQADINSIETDPLVTLDPKQREFTVLELFPLKLNVVSTVAASQGMTLNCQVFGKVNNCISAYNFIVMSTRSSSSDDLAFYIADKTKPLVITPLDDKTSETIKKLFVLSLQTTGILQ